MDILDVNVCGLPPPEPMQVILSALASLPRGAVLKVAHQRQPYPLYERLLANGWLYHSVEKPEQGVDIYIANALDKAEFFTFLKGHV
ncbi:Uncharacterized conserved protein [Colwellia chukchiensis]|uniref:Uncharacterized conserved protein n=1 Tax=Colwellia chukchiensis TaxID=641665 RepID=A0A1H7NMT3_9GAMM|nr:DUF2249 domain-containing protein [Colwellia chukchiensis]SEL24893.1 Uncharacterized conserved protein [Colwellia chukchiensis]